MITGTVDTCLRNLSPVVPALHQLHISLTYVNMYRFVYCQVSLRNKTKL